MINNNPAISIPEVTALQIEVEVLKEREKHYLQKIDESEQALKEAKIEIQVRDGELKKLNEQVNKRKDLAESVKYDV